MHRRPNIALLFLMGCILFGCHIGDIELDKVKSPIYSPTAAILIGNASYTISELVDDLDDERLEVQEGEDFFLTFIYTDSASFENSQDFVQIDDVVNTATVDPGIDTPPSPVELRIPVSQVFEFEFPASEDEQIDSVNYSSGTLEIDFSSDFNADVNYTLTIVGTSPPGSDEDHQVLGTIDYRGSSPVVDRIVIDLEEFKTRLTNINGNNAFFLQFDGELIVPVGSSIQSSDVIDILFTIRNPTFSAVFGNFGNDVTELQNQSIDLDGFEDFGDVGLEILAPSITFTVNNGYGLPMGISLAGFKGINNDQDEIVLAGSIVDNLISINAPDVAGENVNTVFSIDNTNSNIAELLSTTPIRIDIPVSATANPPGSNAVTNFLTDSSDVQLEAAVEIPLELRMDGFSRSFDFDISDFNIDDATEITIRILSTNEIPMSGSLDIMFVNDNNEVLHEVTNQPVLVSPNVGPDGRAVNVTTNSHDIVLDQAGIDAFVDATKVEASINVTSFDAANNTYVKIFSDYRLELELAFFGQFAIEL